MSLDLLRKRQRNPFFRTLLEDVRTRVKSGQLLSEAFEAQGKGQGAISKVYTTTLLAGERSGRHAQARDEAKERAHGWKR